MKFSLFAISMCAVATAACAGTTEQWPMFRGPNGSGVSETAKPPLEFGPEKNVIWKIPVPSSPSSPCVWEDRLFLTTYADGKLETRCYSVKEGKLLWSRISPAEQVEEFLASDGSPAASTPATDGQYVVSYFGSCGLVCHDVSGKEVWRYPLPAAQTFAGYGSGTSPLIAGNLVILNRDQVTNSSLLAVDLRTGKKAWETPRPEAITSWGTPIVWTNQGTEEIVTPGNLLLKGYSARTGEQRWLLSGVSHSVCTTPVLGDGLLFFGAWGPGKSDAPFPTWEQFTAQNDKNKDGVITPEEMEPPMRPFIKALDLDHDGRVTKADFDQLQSFLSRGENVLVAVKPGGQGDISQSHAAWKATRGIPYIASPLYYQGRVYLVKDGGMVSCLEAKSGAALYTQERLPARGNYYASPVAADGRIIVASLDGKVTVFKAGGDKPEILHEANFGDIGEAASAIYPTESVRSPRRSSPTSAGGLPHPAAPSRPPACAPSRTTADLQLGFGSRPPYPWRSAGTGR